MLTDDRGVAKVERKLGVENLYDPEREIETLHHVEQALRAHALYASATATTWSRTARC